MYLRLIAMFSLGATVGYAAHRPAEPATVTAAPVLRTADVAPPPRAFVHTLVAPQLPDGDPPAEPEAAPADAATAPDPPSDPEPRGVLEGKVTNRAGEPIYWVEVTAQARLGDPVVTHTNSDGIYSIEGLPSGVYKLHFACNWMADADGDAGVNQLDPTDHDVTLDALE
jgi:hypothetical protein